jgi:hypothetical protein
MLLCGRTTRASAQMVRDVVPVIDDCIDPLVHVPD